MAKDKKNKSSKSAKGEKKSLFSERQKVVLLVVLLLMICCVPIFDSYRACKAKCLQRIKTPYPEIACKYERCWPWEKKK
ncbi:MAG: hypothetical protein HQL18_01130 [Candidatus Omnitrophica bacterium]|nr:hypothetical protein [Candidatus Omnitrophota bacterium]